MICRHMAVHQYNLEVNTSCNARIFEYHSCCPLVDTLKHIAQCQGTYIYYTTSTVISCSWGFYHCHYIMRVEFLYISYFIYICFTGA